jgi:hypothetical protein
VAELSDRADRKVGTDAAVTEANTEARHEAAADIGR